MNGLVDDDKKEYHNRYIMHETDATSKAWWVDIINKPNGIIVIKINGRRTVKPMPEFRRLIAADNEMQQALAAFMIAVDKPE